MFIIEAGEKETTIFLGSTSRKGPFQMYMLERGFTPARYKRIRFDDHGQPIPGGRIYSDLEDYFIVKDLNYNNLKELNIKEEVITFLRLISLGRILQAQLYPITIN